MRTDVVEYAGDGAADPVVEALRRVDVHRTTGILASLMMDGVMGRKGTAQGHKCLPFIAHQMSAGLNCLRENPIGFGLRKVLNHCGPNLARSRADAHIRRPLHGHECRCFQGFRLTFTSTAGWRIVRIPPRLAADIEAVDFDHTIKGMLASDHQTQGVAHTPGGRLANAEGLCQANGGNPLVRLQHQPEAGEPSPQREFRRVQRCAGCDGELKPAGLLEH